MGVDVRFEPGATDGSISTCDDAPVRPSVPAAFAAAVLLWIGLLAASPLLDTLDSPLAARLDGVELPECSVHFPEDAKIGSFGAYGTVSVPRLDGGSVECQAVFDWPGSQIPPLAGETYRARVSLSAFEDDESSDRIRRGHLLRARLYAPVLEHPGGVLDAISSFRRQAIGLFAHRESEGAALVRALVLGDRSALSEGELYESMQIIGLAHLVAVSGAHLSIVAAMAGALLRRLRIHRYVAVAAVCVGMCSYVVLTGCSVSVIRAAVMACIGLASVFARRRSSSLSALSVCVCVMLAIRPENAWSLSFQLSVLATFGVVVFTSLASCWLRRVPRFIPRSALDALAMTFAANLTVLPVSACVFGRVPVLGMLANIPATLFLAVFLPPACAAVLCFAAAPAYLSEAACAVVDALCVIAQPFAQACIAASSLPGASAPAPDSPVLFALASAAVVAALWAKWPVGRRRFDRSAPFIRRLGVSMRGRGGMAAGVCAVVAIVCIIVFAGARYLTPDRIVMLDVGQGDAFLIQSRGESVLVDTGERDADLLHGLARCGAVGLDAVVITHHDADHCGALAALRGTVRVSGVYSSAGIASCPCEGCSALRREAQMVCGGPLAGLNCGDSFQVGAFSVRVVWPAELEDEGGNADSVCLVVEHGAGDEVYRALLVGDAESEQLAEIMEREGLEDVDIYKVGHHGSKAAITPEQAAALNPAVALISVGEGNDYGHPAPSTVDALEAAGAKVFRTDLAGIVCCNFRNGRVEVDTMR